MGRAGIVETVSALFLFLTGWVVNKIEMELTGKELAAIYRLIEAELEKPEPLGDHEFLQSLRAKFAAAILQSCRDR